MAAATGVRAVRSQASSVSCVWVSSVYGVIKFYCYNDYRKTKGAQQQWQRKFLLGVSTISQTARTLGTMV